MVFKDSIMRTKEKINLEEDEFIKDAIDRLTAQHSTGESKDIKEYHGELGDIDAADDLEHEGIEDSIIEDYSELPLAVRNKVVGKLLASSDVVERRVLGLINKFASRVEIDKNLKAQLDQFDKSLRP